MKKLWDMLDNTMIGMLGTLWIVSLIALSFGVAIWSVSWVLKLVGVL